MADKGRINQVIYIMGLPSLNSLPSRLRYLPLQSPHPYFVLFCNWGKRYHQETDVQVGPVQIDSSSEHLDFYIYIYIVVEVVPDCADEKPQNTHRCWS